MQFRFLTALLAFTVIVMCASFIVALIRKRQSDGLLKKLWLPLLLFVMATTWSAGTDLVVTLEYLAIRDEFHLDGVLRFLWLVCFIAGVWFLSKEIPHRSRESDAISNIPNVPHRHHSAPRIPPVGNPRA
jgi:uncharacterized membrane protein YciS (DUF1049 family)